MRVLIAHNRYQSAAPSGENRAVELEIAGLRDRGVEVLTYLRESDELEGDRRVQAEAVAALFRPARTLRTMRELLRESRPDVLHLHNPYPLIPPSVIRLAHEQGVAVVQTLHNGRHGCSRADFTRDGRPCMDCVGLRFPAPSVVHSCYRGSAAQSMILATSLAIHRGTFAEVDRFVAVSPTLRDQLASAQLPAERIDVVPNGIPDPGPPRGLGANFLFIGRLEEQKGINRLLSAWREAGDATGRQLVIVGSGGLEADVEQAAAAMPSIRYAGYLRPDQVHREMSQALAVIVPSVVPESFGLTTIEAFAAGRAVIASAIGALNDLVDDSVGWRIESTQDLIDLLADFDSRQAAERGLAARDRFLERFVLDRTSERLVEVFESVSRNGPPRSRVISPRSRPRRRSARRGRGS